MTQADILFALYCDLPPLPERDPPVETTRKSDKAQKTTKGGMLIIA